VFRCLVRIYLGKLPVQLDVMDGWDANGSSSGTYLLAGFGGPTSGPDLSNSVNILVVSNLIQGF
jgi:hypothetical protein